MFASLSGFKAASATSILRRLISLVFAGWVPHFLIRRGLPRTIWRACGPMGGPCPRKSRGFPFPFSSTLAAQFFIDSAKACPGSSPGQVWGSPRWGAPRSGVWGATPARGPRGGVAPLWPKAGKETAREARPLLFCCLLDKLALVAKNARARILYKRRSLAGSSLGTSGDGGA